MNQLSIFDYEYQPRFQAFLKYKGASSHKEVHTYDFQIWIHRNLETFKKIRAIDTLNGHHDDFTQFLWEEGQSI